MGWAFVVHISTVAPMTLKMEAIICMCHGLEEYNIITALFFDDESCKVYYFYWERSFKNLLKMIECFIMKLSCTVLQSPLEAGTWN